MNLVKTMLFALECFVSVCIVTAQESEIPFIVNDLFDFNRPHTLGLSFVKGAETYQIFSPQENENKYNHGVVLFSFKNQIYAQWQSSSIDEDGPDTQVFYSKSNNGKNWSLPLALTNKKRDGIETNGGWWSDGESLICFINVWSNHKERYKEGFTQYIKSNDGVFWELPKPVTNSNGIPIKGIIEQDMHTYKNRLITAFHLQPGLHAKPFYTDNLLGVSGWTEGIMDNLNSNSLATSREIEPSWFYNKDGYLIMVFRDQHGSYKKLASMSKDMGKSWTKPTIVNTPDSRAKQSAGNLPDGTAFMINNPSGNKNRYPLVITLSKDGYIFDKAFLIRAGGNNLQPLRFQGKYKREGYSYPKSIVIGDYLYVSYATNKEDVEITRIPIANLVYK